MSKYETLTLIVSTLGVIATFSAVFVALWQSKLANKKKLKLFLNEDSTVLDPTTGAQVKCIELKISNIGNRVVNITNAKWISASKKLNYRLFFTPGINHLENAVFSDFNDGYRIEPEKQVSVLMPRKAFLQQLVEEINNGKKIKNNKFCVTVFDETGKKYTIKSKMKIREFLENNKCTCKN